ncbi:MAG TPA: ABC transporter permease [Acidimicrobiia bacterium]|nr:ABC transporter permease [Acidimicrobiia bacterium]
MTSERLLVPDTTAGPTLWTRFLAAPNAVRLVSLIVVMSSWELYGRTNPIFASYPSAIISAATRTMVDKVLPALQTTLWGFTVGFLIAAPLGILFGIALGRVKLLEVSMTPFMMAIYSTPRVTLIPLLVLWLGIDFRLRVAIVALSSIFPIIINMHAGVKEVDRELLDVGRAFTASRRQELLTIVLPGSLPFMFTGLRIGLARALGGVITAELTAAVVGIGRLIIDGARFLRLDEMFVPLILFGILSISFTAILGFLQRLAMPWHTAATKI